MKFPKNTFSKNLPITETNPAPSSATLFIKFVPFLFIAAVDAILMKSVAEEGAGFVSVIGKFLECPFSLKNPLERLSGMTWQAEIPK
jgi:hypothetical protein